MSEQPKRGLRPKRPPKYRASDVNHQLSQEQDPDNPSHTRPNYAKISSASHTHDYVSPSVVLNQNAKLLVKFINKANKGTNFGKEDLRDMRLMREESEKEQGKKESVQKDKMSVQPQQATKKQPSSARNQKTQPPKKKNQLYNFKGLHQNGQLLKNISQQQVLKGVKGIQSLSGLINNINNKGIYSGPVSSQLSQLRSLYPNLKDFNYQTLTQSPNPNLFEFNQQSSPQQPPKPSSTQPPNQTPPTQKTTSDTPKPTTKQAKSQPKRPEVQEKPDEKIFKRSAYHVAIAYHIYLKGLYEQGITSGNLIDPTYKARLVKEQAGQLND